MQNISKKQFATGTFWKIVEQFSAKGVSFVVSIIIMRIMGAEAYGILALTAIFTNFSDMLIDAGFTTALIRKEKVDDYDYSSVLLMSMLIALVLYTGIFFGAPYFAGYYRKPELLPVLRVICLMLFIQAFSSTRNAYIARNMQFKFLFRCNLTASVISGILGIVSAYSGLGVWALVIQQLSQVSISTILLFLRIKWNFKWKIDFQRIKSLAAFGLGVVGSSFINYLASSVSSLIIGKRFSVTDLGYSDKGGQFPMQLSLYTFGAMSSVLLPTISSYQNDLDRVKTILRRVTRMTAFLITPLMVGMAVTSREIILLLLKEQWLPIERIMQCSCLYYLATPFMLINVQLFFALGHSFIRVRTEIIRITMVFISLGMCVLLNWTIYDLALAGAIIAVLAALVTSYEAWKLIRYNAREMFSDVWKPFLTGAVMGAAVLLTGKFFLADVSFVVSLLVKMAVGIVVYLGLALIERTPELYEIFDLIKGFLKKDGKNE